MTLTSTRPPAPMDQVLTYIGAPTGTGKIACNPDRVAELSGDEAREILARVMRMAQQSVADHERHNALAAAAAPAAEPGAASAGVASEVPGESVGETLADTDAVADFMRAFGQTVRVTPTCDITPDERLLRARLVFEEAVEFVSAMGCVAITVGHDEVRKSDTQVYLAPGADLDLVDATDALADIIVVTKGSAHTLGVPIDEAFRAVHSTNMAKLDPATGKPIKRADGKVIKPDGWQPPTDSLTALLRRYGWDG